MPSPPLAPDGGSLECNARFSPQTLVIVGTVLLTICWSAIFASHFALSTEAWEQTYGYWGHDRQQIKVGWLIEGGRATFNVVVTALIIGVLFSPELSAMLGRRQDSDSLALKYAVWIARSAWIGIAAFTLFNLFNYHWTTGPGNLVERKLTAETVEQHRVTYLCYMPYSIVLFAVVDVTLLVVPLLGGVFGYLQAKQLEGELRKQLGDATKISGKLKNYYQQEYFQGHALLIRRYVDLNAAIFAGLVAEYTLFHHTLSGVGMAWVWFAGGLISLNFVCIYIICCVYDSGFQPIQRLDVGSPRWTTKFTSFELLKATIVNSPSGIPIRILLGVVRSRTS